MRKIILVWGLSTIVFAILLCVVQLAALAAGSYGECVTMIAPWSTVNSSGCVGKSKVTTVTHYAAIKGCISDPEEPICEERVIPSYTYELVTYTYASTGCTGGITAVETLSGVEYPPTGVDCP